MAELIKTFEVVGKVLQTVHKMGSFVVERFQGGGHGWDDLPKKPVQASITHYGEEINIERAAE